MIFSIQRYVEDYAAQRGLRDSDQYAVKIANLYDARRGEFDSASEFLKQMKKIRTGFFVQNSLDRGTVERELLNRLDRKFKKKARENFPGGVVRERNRLANRKKRSIKHILGEFKRATEAKAIDSFWESRSRGELKPSPEKNAQALIATFIFGVLDGKGVVFREVASGVGFVDIAVLLSTVPHLLELKILRNKVTGAAQLGEYMRLEGRRTGWLVLFDARPLEKRKDDIPKRINITGSTIHVVVIDLLPSPPSSK